MKKQEMILLVLLVLFTAALRLSVLSIGNFINYDDFYHLSIVKSALANHHLPDSTNLDFCYSDMPSKQPMGLYIFPYILSLLGINIETSFMISSMLAACITLILFYFFLKKVFGFKTAIISAFLLSATLSYFSRSSIFYYRGENFVYPFLLASLLLCISMFKSESKDKFIFASLAGAVSALAAFVWTGYPFVLVITFIALFLYLAINFIEMKEIKKDVYASALFLIVQFIVLKIIILITHLESAFTSYSSYIYPSALLALGFFYLAEKIKNSKTRLISLAALIFIFIIFLLFSPFTKSMLSGFGFIIPQLPFYKIIQELQPITLAAIWRTIWLTFALAIPGFLIFALSLKRPLEAEKIVFLAMLLPSLYLLTTTIRFLFLASIPLAALAGRFLAMITELSDKKTMKIMLGAIPVIVIILSSVYTYNMYHTTTSPAKEYIISSLEYFKDNTQEHSCLVVIQDWGGLVEYYAERPTYQSSVTQPILRVNNYLLFLLGEKGVEIFDVENAYAGLFSEDFPRIKAAITATETEDKGFGYEFLSLGKQTEEDDKIVYRYNNGNYELTISKDNQVNAFRKGDKIRTVFLENNNKVQEIIDENASEKGCLFVGPSLSSYFNEKLCQSNMVKMLSQQKIDGMELWYSAPGVRIYKVIQKED